MSADAAVWPVTDDEAARLWPVVADLLRSVPEVWSAFDRDNLTATQDRALYLLTAAGLIERRFGGRWQMASGSPDVIEATTITFTGESGLGFAMAEIAAEIGRLSEERIEAGEYRGGRAYRFERTGPGEWRLSDMGALAKSDLGRATEFNVFNAVMRRGTYDGRPWKWPNGEIIQIDHIHGYGKADWRTIPAAAGLLRVNVANWGEGADALADPIVAKIQRIIDDAVAKRSCPGKPQSGGKGGMGTDKKTGPALLAALSDHHKYDAEGGCTNTDPITSAALGDLAKVGKKKVGKTTAWQFINSAFGSNQKYRAKCDNPHALWLHLKRLRGEFTDADLKSIQIEAFEAGKDARKNSEDERD